MACMYNWEVWLAYIIYIFFTLGFMGQEQPKGPVVPEKTLKGKRVVTQSK